MRLPARALVRSLAPALTAGLVLAGCTAAGATQGPPDGSTPSSAPTASAAGSPSPEPQEYAVSSDPNALVLRVDTTGGLVAPGYFLTHVPEFSLFADGRVIVPGAVDASYPGPLLPNLEQGKLSPEELQRLLAVADGAGLLGPDAAYHMGGVADAGTTIFQTTVAGKTHRISAYALGIGDDTSMDPAPAEARARLLAFRSKILDLRAVLGHSLEKVPYLPTAARLFVGTPAEVQPPMTQPILTWPLSVDPASGTSTTNPAMKCISISGADLTTFLASAKTTSALTVWNAPSGSYSVQVRLLLPGESGCA